MASATASSEWQIAPVLNELAAGANLSMQTLHDDPVNPDHFRAIYHSIMRRPGSDTAVSTEVFDTIFADVVRDERLLFDPKDFGRSDHRDLTNFLTSRLRSKFLAFSPWIHGVDLLANAEIVHFPSMQPYAYLKRIRDRHVIVIHYGLSQLVEFTAEQVILTKWIEAAKNAGGLFAAGWPLVERQFETFFVYKMALSNYAQQAPLLLPGVALGLPARFMLELVARVAFAELFIAAHEHVHLSEGHFNRVDVDECAHHPSMHDPAAQLTDDQRLELATDLLALPYFTGHGFTMALNGIASYLLTLGQCSVMFSAPSRSHPPVLDRVHNLVSEAAAIGPPATFPAELYAVMEVLQKGQAQHMGRAKIETVADWPRLIFEYQQLAKQLCELLTLSELANRSSR